MRVWYSGVSSDRIVGIWLCRMRYQYALPGVKPGMLVAAGPFAGHGRVGVLRRAAALRRLGQQRLVMRLRGLERVRADDGLARIVAVAVTPRRRARAPSPPISRPPVAPHSSSSADRAVAAEVARVVPELAILVEILRREQVDRQRRDASRAPRRPAPGRRTCAAAVATGTSVRGAHRGADRRLAAQVGLHGRAATDTLEAGVGHLLRRTRPTCRVPRVRWPPGACSLHQPPKAAASTSSARRRRRGLPL